MLLGPPDSQWLTFLGFELDVHDYRSSADIPIGRAIVAFSTIKLIEAYCRQDKARLRRAESANGATRRAGFGVQVKGIAGRLRNPCTDVYVFRRR